MESSTDTTWEFVGCPACGAPAEIIDRYVLESTDGPIEHTTVRCAQHLRHRFTVLVERLDSARPPATPTRSTGAEPTRWTP